MMSFCSKNGSSVSEWYDYPQDVEEFVDMKGAFIAKGCVWVFVQNEHVWIYEREIGLYEAPEIPDWCPEY